MNFEEFVTAINKRTSLNGILYYTSLAAGIITFWLYVFSITPLLLVFLPISIAIVILLASIFNNTQLLKEYILEEKEQNDNIREKIENEMYQIMNDLEKELDENMKDTKNI